MDYQIEDLAFLAGEWCGKIDTRTVEQNWSHPSCGSMEARVKLADADDVSTIEIIRIAEINAEGGGKGLMSRVRQFTASMDMKVSEDLRLKSLNDNKAVFVSEKADVIRQLTYTLIASDVLTVEVTFATNLSVLAELHRA